jgi:hypothetical protein
MPDCQTQLLPQFEGFTLQLLWLVAYADNTVPSERDQALTPAM